LNCLPLSSSSINESRSVTFSKIAAASFFRCASAASAEEETLMILTSALTIMLYGVKVMAANII
ncbi:MAG TPA: hypothetical protein VEP90_20555, partial [Methylomirabilota bacterium]|nr:hypothetical protein [Methylomirabilota bacterium]